MRQGPSKAFMIGMLVAATIFGVKLYNKSESHDEMKARLLSKCAQDQTCVAALGEFFDSCFDENYDMGGSRRTASFNGTAFLSCFNDKSGMDHFVLEPGEQDHPTAH